MSVKPTGARDLLSLSARVVNEYMLALRLIIIFAETKKISRNCLIKPVAQAELFNKKNWSSARDTVLLILNYVPPMADQLLPANLPFVFHLIHWYASFYVTQTFPNFYEYVTPSVGDPRVRKSLILQVMKCGAEKSCCLRHAGKNAKKNMKRVTDFKSQQTPVRITPTPKIKLA